MPVWWNMTEKKARALNDWRFKRKWEEASEGKVGLSFTPPFFNAISLFYKVIYQNNILNKNILGWFVSLQIVSKSNSYELRSFIFLCLALIGKIFE